MASTQPQRRQQQLVLLLLLLPLLVLAFVRSAGATARYSALQQQKQQQQQDTESERLQQLLERQQQPQPRLRRSLLQQSSAERRHRRLRQQQQQQQQQQRQQQLLQRRELMQSHRRKLSSVLSAGGPLVKLQPSQLAALNSIWVSMEVNMWNDANTGPTCNGDFSNWPGVGCDADGMVVELRLARSTSKGTIPVDLSKLTRLRVFDFHYNDVEGPIPPAALSTLKNLTTIDGAYNYIGNPIPFGALAKLSQFTFLNLSMNDRIHETFATNIAYLPQLRVLDIGKRTIGDGDIVGRLDYFLSSLPNITYLNLDNLKVNGSIPTDIGTANSGLEYLNLEGLDLAPEIPTSLWTLTKLSFLNLRKVTADGGTDGSATITRDEVVRYQGPVPDAIGNLTNLVHLTLGYVGNSPLTPAPMSFSRLTRLTSLSLLACDMYTFPNVFNATRLIDLSLDYTPVNDTTTVSRLTKLTNLLTLALSNTNITQIPALSTLTKLLYLNLAGMNHLELPLDSLTWLTSLNSLNYLNIGDAFNLYGQLPYDLSKLTSLKRLLLPNAKFAVFPYPIFLLSNLEQLELSRSQMNMSALPLELSNLNNLTRLLMQDVGLPGTIPSTLGALTRLLDLDLSNNHLEGPFPTSFNNASILENLQLDGNKLEGPLPDVSGFPALKLLSLSNNQFTGRIPTSFKSLTSLSSLDVSWNNLTGAIPVELGYCNTLQTLNLAGNNFTGGLENLSYLVGLESLILSYIPLSLPAFNQVSTLVYLSGLNARGMGLTGLFPKAVLNLTSLEVLDLSSNKLTGPLPTNLPSNMSLADFSSNNFTGTIPAVLVNRLERLSVASNKLTGALPAIASNSPLEQLNVDRNKLTGPLPDFSMWPETITIVYMSNNEFSGSIPSTISHLKNLNSLYLSNNTITGSLPSAMSNLTALQTLWLQDNDIDGDLPDFLSGMADLRVLVLDRNRLTGTIPQSFCSFTNLQYLGLSANMMYGELPQSNNKPCFAGMDSLNSLDLSNNSFTGRIDYNFEGMNPKLGGTLNVANNYFFGSNELQGGGVIYCPADVPSYVLGADGSFAPPVSEDTNLVSNLNRDQQLATVEPYQSGDASLADNCFQTVESDKCPSLNNQSQRTDQQCLAFCGLQVDAPQPVYCGGHGDCVPVTGSPGTFNCSCDSGYVVSYANGSATCIPPPPAASSGLSTGAIVGIVLGCLVAVVIIIVVLYLLLKPEKEDEGIDLGVCKKYSLADVEAATNNWDKSNFLGEGAYGAVYRGMSPSGEMWAVKRAKVFTNDFENEVRGVASLKHPNLVKLLGYCQNFNNSTGKQEQILMYEFVSNGDLSAHLFGKKEDALSLQQRLDIATGMAKGLAYLHGFPEPIVHRDIKTENVLIDERMQAKIADFGLLKKLDECEAENQSRVAGTPGYVDPEYNRSEMVSSKSDVYSFGIVLLEMISGRRAIESNRSHISQWAYAMVQANNVDELRDRRMVGTSDDMILDLADVAFDCLKRPRTRRPNMDAVRIRLENIRVAYMSGSTTYSRGAIDSYSVRDAGPSATSDNGPLIEEPMSTADMGTTSQSHIGNWNAQPAPR